MQPSHKSRAGIFLLCLATVWSVFPLAGRAQFTEIAGSGTAIPGGTGDFVSVPANPCISGNTVVFKGTGGGGQVGIYASTSGTLTRIADTNTPTSPGGGNFTAYPSDPCVSGNNTTFLGAGTGGQVGVYATLGGTLTTIADTNTPIPNGTGNFVSLPADPCISGSAVAFAGGGSGGQFGVYAAVGGSLFTVANTITPIPSGTGNFNFAAAPADPCISGANIAFAGSGTGGQIGLYALISGSPGRFTNTGNFEKIADTSTAIPGGTGNFTFAAYPADPCISGSNIAFVGSGSGGQDGIYKDVDGVLSMVADLNTPIPGGTGTFTSTPSDPCIDGDAVAFVGNGSNGQQGIYTDFGGTLTDVIDVSQELNGKQLESLNSGRFAMDGDPMLTFQATFTDGSQGIFSVAVVPEPVGMGMVALAAMAFLRRRARAMD